MVRNVVLRGLGIVLIGGLLLPSMEGWAQERVPPASSDAECQEFPGFYVVGELLEILLVSYLQLFTDGRVAYEPGDPVCSGSEWNPDFGRSARRSSAGPRI